MKKLSEHKWHFRKDGSALAERRTEPNASSAKAPSFWEQRRTWLFLLVCLLGSAAASYGVFKYVLPSLMAPNMPPELVGNWRVVTGDMEGAGLEFHWYGSASATAFEQGRKVTINYSVKVEDNKIHMVSTNEKTGKTETVVQTILKLTPDELVIRDEDNKEYHMVRVRS